MVSVRLGKPLRRAIERGHPWVYRDAITKPPQLAPATVVTVVDKDGPIAFGYWDAVSPIAVRILGMGKAPKALDSWCEAQIRTAINARELEPALQQTNAWRLLHGESDYVPGLLIDQYDHCARVVYDGPAAEEFWRAVDLSSVWQRRGIDTVVASSRSHAPQTVRGTHAGEVQIFEGPAQFSVDLVHGQKTGFFLDQRANRLCLAPYCAGADVLNLFSYTGGFSVHAALAGAARVTSVDIGGPVIDAAKKNFAINDLSVASHEFATEDAKAFLTKAAADGRRWDIVVCDPPNFAPKESAKQSALGAYTNINALAAEVVAAGGLLVSASCSSHVRAPDLATCVARALQRANRRGRIVRQSGADVDHPQRPGFPESDYLQCYFVRLI